LARINGSHCVAKIGEHSPGDLGNYCEIDSVCPDEAPYRFPWTKRGESAVAGTVKERIQTRRMIGKAAQGLLLTSPHSDSTRVTNLSNSCGEHAELSGGNPMWCGVSATAVSAQQQSVRHMIAAQLLRAPGAVRTVVAGLGLLGQLARKELLASGVDAAGLVRVDDDGMVILAHAFIGEVAVAKLTLEDREQLHIAWAERLGDLGEVARHFEAGGERSRATAAAVGAAHSADLLSSARHLTLAARCTQSRTNLVAAAIALAAVGDLAAASAHATRAEHDIELRGGLSTRRRVLSRHLALTHHLTVRRTT